MKQKTNNRKNKDKEKALQLLNELGTLRSEQTKLAKTYDTKQKRIKNFKEKIHTNKQYCRLRDSIDLKADVLAEQYMDILKKHAKQKIKKVDFKNFNDGILDKKYLDALFKDDQDKRA